MDGNIEEEIQLDQVNIEAKDTEKSLAILESTLANDQAVLREALETEKLDQLVRKASVSKKLKEYMECRLESLLLQVSKPPLPKRPVTAILGDLDALKTIPAEPDYPETIEPLRYDLSRLKEVDSLIEKITSPSSISEEIKNLISLRPEFFETGCESLKVSGNENCPFCQQSIAHPPASDSIQQYIAYFADAEGRHKRDLRAAWIDIQAHLSSLKNCIASVGQEILKFESLRKCIPSQREVVLPNLSVRFEQLEKILGDYQKAIEAKGLAPGIKVSVPAGDIQGLLIVTNRDINVLGDLFTNITAAVKASDSERKKLQREICQVFGEEFAYAHWSKISMIHTLRQNIAKVNGELQGLKKSLPSAKIKARVAATFEVLIRSFFSNKYTFDRDEFILKRENRKMARGVNRTLSDGEKTACPGSAPLGQTL